MAGNRISVRALDSDGLGLKTMAESGKTDNFGETLKPFYLRASAAEVCIHFPLFPTFSCRCFFILMRNRKEERVLVCLIKILGL